MTRTLTVRELAAKLQALPEHAQDWPCYGVVGSSGVSYAVGFLFPRKGGRVDNCHDAGDVLDIGPQDPYVEVYLGL